MNIFLHELKVYRKSTVIWTLSLVALVVLFMSLFPSISKDVVDFKKLLEGYPEGIRKAFGIEIESIGSILGFYSYIFLYLMLCGAIQGMNLGTSIISKEVREKTADFLLTKPVTRTKILTAKLLAAIVSLIMTNVIFLLAASIMASRVKSADYNLKLFIMISLTLFFVQLMFLTLGFMISAIVPKIRSVLTVSLGTVFAFFIISMLVSISGDEAIRYFSPFRYFDTTYIIENSSYESSFMIASIAIIVISIVTSYIVYTKKDIHSV